MPFQRSRYSTLAIAAVFLILTGRVAWHAADTATGWETIREGWVKTSAALVDVDRFPLSKQDPPEQANVWLQEVASLVPAQQTAIVAAGAACLLDAPQTGFLPRYVRRNKQLDEFVGLPLGFRLELDDAAIHLALDQFEDRCHRPCLELIEKATHLDPSNVDLWRARAVLLFRQDFNGAQFTPRQDDWQFVLAECAQHDPENALYDYLAAHCEWSTSVDFRWHSDGYVLEVKDQEGLERSSLCFAAGLAKRHLQVGTTHARNVWEFLKYSSVSRMECLTAAENSSLGPRATNLLIGLMRRQDVMQSVQRRQNNPAAAVETLRQSLFIAGQVSPADNPVDLISWPLWLRRWGHANLAILAAQSPDLIDTQEAKLIESVRESIRLDLAVSEKAIERWQSRIHPQRSAHPIAAFLSTLTQPLAQTFLLCGLSIAIFAWFCSRGTRIPPVSIGVGAHLVAWAIGFSLSLILFGLCPAEIISTDVQTFIWWGFCCVLLLVTVPAALSRLNRQRLRWIGHFLALYLSCSLPCLVFVHSESTRDILIATVSRLHPLGTLLLLATVISATWHIVRLDLAFLCRADINVRQKSWQGLIAFSLAIGTAYFGSWISAVMRTVLETKHWIPPRTWNEIRTLGLSADEFNRGFQLPPYPWVRALLQWDAYSGFYVGFTLTLLILAGWCARQQIRATPGRFPEFIRHGKLACARLISFHAARSLLTAGMIAAAVYLATIPTAIDEIQQQYQRRSVLINDPTATRREVELEMAAIRRDAVLMTELRRIVEQQTRALKNETAE